MRALIYHAESESLFETTWEAFEATPDSIDKALCADVTGIPEFEERFAREKIDIEGEGEPAELREVANVTLMGIKAKRMYRNALAEAKAIGEQNEEKEATPMARESAAGGARSSMRDAARKRAEEQTHGGGGFSIALPDGVTFFKNDGKTVEFDFIPYVISDARNPDVLAGRLRIGDLVDARTYWMHRDVGAEQKPYICLKTIGKPCPICEAQVAMAKNPKADPDDAKALKSKERVLYNVIDANDKDGKIMVYDVSYHLFTKQLEHEQREREEYYDYADPDNGYTLRIRYEKKSIGRGEPFFEADRIDFEKRKPLSAADLKAAVDLDAALTVLSYEKLEAIFLGVDGGDAAAEDEARSRSLAAGKGDPGAPSTERARRGGSEDEGRAGRRPAEPEPARGRRDAAPPVEEPARGRRNEAPAPDPHRHDPDAERGRGKAPAAEPEEYKGELDPKCPGGGVFGKDENELEHCNKCNDETWKACRAEKDRMARDAKAAKPAAEEKPTGRRR